MLPTCGGSDMSSEHIETPDEIEASLRKREEMFQQWAKSREAANTVTKSAPAQNGHGGRFRINQTEPYVLMEVVGEKLAEERAARKRLEAEVSALKLELAELRGRIIERGEAAQASSAPRLKVVPPTDKDTMIG